jgi:hypothetical protein
LLNEIKDYKKMNEHHKHNNANPTHTHAEEGPGKTFETSGKQPEELNIPNERSYYMKFSISKSRIYPNQEAALSFVPAKKGKEKERVLLEVQHGKKMHLIIVSEDLSYFNHIHPDVDEPGAFTANTFFPLPGNYTLFAEYKPVGGEHTVDKFAILVEGYAPEPRVYSKEKLTGHAGLYSFSLEVADGQIIAGAANHIDVTVKKDGKQIDVNTLEDYLGAKAHVVIISAKDKEFLHVHPIIKDNKLLIHTDFKNPGIYRGWIQFQDKQQLHTIDFTLKAVAGQQHSTGHILNKTEEVHRH